MSTQRRSHYDVTDQVCIARPQAVCDEVECLLTRGYPEIDRAALRAAFSVFGQLYAGTLPGYVGCDTGYHDAQHSLDCALATARLLDGHARASGADQRLDSRRAVLGCIIALFHDAGYIRRDGDSGSNGAVYTLTHVRRSGEFLAQLLPQIGYDAEAELAAKIVHFTGYEIPLSEIPVHAPKDRQLAFLIASADLLSQLSDACYPEKCRDFLFPEFECCGLAGPAQPGGPVPLYTDRMDLLNGTPAFYKKLRRDRLDGYFDNAHRYLDAHFRCAAGVHNPYDAYITHNLERIDKAIALQSLDVLTLKPEAIDAAALRDVLDGCPGKFERDRAV
jgi:hypothetical protein